MPKAPAAGAPPCVLCLSAHGLRCLQRFHAKHGQQAAMLFEEAGSWTPSSCECRLNDRAFWGQPIRAPGAGAGEAEGACEHRS